MQVHLYGFTDLIRAEFYKRITLINKLTALKILLFSLLSFDFDLTSYIFINCGVRCGKNSDCILCFTIITNIYS